MLLLTGCVCFYAPTVDDGFLASNVHRRRDGLLPGTRVSCLCCLYMCRRGTMTSPVSARGLCTSLFSWWLGVRSSKSLAQPQASLSWARSKPRDDGNGSYCGWTARAGVFVQVAARFKSPAQWRASSTLINISSELVELQHSCDVQKR